MKIGLLLFLSLAFVEMILAEPSSRLQLQHHATDELVIGDGSGAASDYRPIYLPASSKTKLKIIKFYRPIRVYGRPTTTSTTPSPSNSSTEVSSPGSASSAPTAGGSNSSIPSPPSAGSNSSITSTLTGSSPSSPALPSSGSTNSTSTTSSGATNSSSSNSTSSVTNTPVLNYNPHVKVVIIKNQNRPSRYYQRKFNH